MWKKWQEKLERIVVEQEVEVIIKCRGNTLDGEEDEEEKENASSRFRLKWMNDQQISKEEKI